MSYLTSTAFAIGAHTTNMLDRFQNTAREFVKNDLDITSLLLGTTSLAGMLSTQSDEELSKDTYFKY